MTTQAKTDAPVSGPYAEHVVVLGEGPRPDPAVLGGKAARLGEMLADGLPVPPALCLSTGLYTAFLEESGLADELHALDGRSARERVLATEIPSPVAEAILAGYERLGRCRVAVRSSAPREDSAEQSFAGQHDTVLDVADDAALLDAVRTCWASLWSERATAYRAVDGGPGAIAVVVQEMVHSDVSGVAFTVDPVSARPHRIVVEACQGLGEGLVSGRVSSDFFVVDDRTLEVVEERVRHKVTKCAPLGSGKIGMTRVEAAARNVPCLNAEQLAELCEHALFLRRRYGSEQDIEWGMRDGTLWFFQTRPITTGPEAGNAAAHTGPVTPYVTPQKEKIEQDTLWSRMDIGEIFVGLMTPLGESFARYYQQHVHLDCTSALGARVTGDPDLPMGYVQGHVYLNISYSAYVMAQCLPTRDQWRFTSRFVSEEVDLTGYENPFGAFPGGIADALSIAFWLRTTANEATDMKARAERMSSSRAYEFDRDRAVDLTRMSRRELDAELRRRLAYFHDMHVGYMPYYIHAFGFYAVLAELCKQWLGNEGDNLQNRVKTDMSNLRTVESAKEIWRVAQAAKDRPRVLRIIDETPLESVAATLRADEEGALFWKEWMDPFLRDHGTRGPQEMEITHARWIDDPSYVFQMIRRYAADGYSSEDILRRSGSHQDTTSHTALERLSLPKRKAVETAIAMYRTYSELREIARMSMITSIWLVRNVVYEVGRRLLEAGVLHSTSEVAYLDFEDIRGYLAGTASEAEAFDRSGIERARRLHEYHKRLPEPPLTFVGTCDPTAAVRPVPDGERLEGLGSSPGRVVGRARVIEELVWQADEFQAGEILITRYTDATWTPLFAIAGGVVTDIGSMLSHSSIVSREFNVPSVVNTKHATQVIRTGDLIVVDGDAGTVEVVENP
ncbi:PEP-utilizing enzyme [Streptomyces tubbatahanensis]|uniref:PEP-utilizing enzyme n=1 Tax=Streptomyces tubbatahanensis TaxID=2923272 RepID=A0ABY3XZU7_9ACTN|nr:PEP/pyruvate-binding domain-containing protein [Streptomyces tubbatahanensis]UNS99808.1 PEP-utilizing enzyme [Streptomyces tubbatahanensis]